MVCKLCMRKSKIIRICEVTIGFMSLICGCMIYLLFRSKSLNIYQWSVAFGLSNIIDSFRYAIQNWSVAGWIRYSLPDGLYNAAYILLMDAIWYDDNNLKKFVIILIVPLITICSELFQYIGLIKGTFDVYDLICYIIPLMIYIINSIYNLPKFNKFKTRT